MAYELHCKQHANARAGWTCEQCHSTLCQRCAWRRKAGQGWLIVCGQCGGLAQPIMVSRAMQSFAALIPGAFLYPFSQSGLITMLAAGIILTLMGFGGTISALVGAGTFISYTFLVIRTTASGYNDVPEAEDFTHVLDLLGALFRFVVAMSASVVPVFVYAFYFKTSTGYFNDPWLYLTLLAGIVWAPMACMQAATHSPLLAIVNPVFAVGYILRIFGDYCLASAIFWVLAAGTVIINVLGIVLQENIHIPLLPHMYASAVGMYLPLVSSRILGLLLFVRGSELGYGAQREYEEPALGDTQPPPEPTAVVAPVSTMQDSTEGFQSFSSMEGHGFQTLNESQTSEPLPLGNSDVDALDILPIASTSVQDEFAAFQDPPSALDLGVAARAQAAAQPTAPSERSTDQEIRAMAEAGRFDFVARAYRDRLGVVAVLSAEELRRTAEAAGATGDVETATHALRRLAHDFPGSILAPDALLDAGVLLTRELGQPEEGQTLLEHLVAAYPQSKAAAEGRRILKPEAL
jgi:hypothetical protein